MVDAAAQFFFIAKIILFDLFLCVDIVYALM